MSVYLRDPDLTLHQGDALDVLRSLPDGSVDCCVTSPPYWGLRDYGTGQWEGGNPDHRHDTVAARGGRGGSGSPGKQTEGAFPSDYPVSECSCGATRADRQLGLEPTPDAYVARMVEVFREVRRVLLTAGSLWLNIGDSYADANRHSERRAKDASGVVRPVEMKGCERCGASFEAAIGRRFCSAACGGSDNSRRHLRPGALKAKDLCGIPWRLAFALQQDGWYLRSDIIWSKPNPMPESVTDRPTKAHEYVFLLTKESRYFFDQEAVREPHSSTRWGGPTITQPPTTKYAKATHDGFNGAAEALSRPGREWNAYPDAGRNVRSVWEIATQPYPDAHFATFPEELVRRCILAGCPEGGTVLDPFGGSGTTALVARKHGRRSVLVELNESYCALAAKRLSQLSLLTVGS